jgi:GTPase
VDRSRNGRSKETRHGANGAGVSNRRARQRALAIGIADGQEEGEPLAELKELLRTAGVATAGEMLQQRSAPDPDRYFGRGKLAELKTEIGRSGANLVACDDELAPRQERNLEAALGVPVIDRTAVILDIFADHAHSAEGKLQVELAQLEYNMARMRGLWTHLERLGAGRIDGGIGTRGPGETQIETDRRLARNRISALRDRMQRLERNRGTMRARRERSSLPRIALAGYTNAGKSTLLNALTGAEVGVGDRLFHTLDPTTRNFELSGREYLLTDTVGFIEKLPHQLVEAFKATLEETVLADLILHVVDAAAPEERQPADMRAVDAVLDEIGAGDKPRLLVLNKADLLGAGERGEALLRHPDAVLVSALEDEGIETLRERIEAAFEDTLAEVELLVPYSEGARLHELHELAGELERAERGDGVLVRARVPVTELHRFDDLRTDGVGTRVLSQGEGGAAGEGVLGPPPPGPPARDAA